MKSFVICKYSILQSFLYVSRYYEDRMSRIKQKRQPQYISLCGTEESTVSTSSLDPNPCSNCLYFPSQLNQVKCATSNSLNARGHVSCSQNIPGDCLNVHATIKVTKVFPSSSFVDQNINLKVGCSCFYVSTS